MHRILFFLLLLAASVSAQQKKQVGPYDAIDKKALQIPLEQTKTVVGISNYVNATFKTEKEKIRAVFIWVASNIQYDIDNMFAVNYFEKEEEKILKPLKTRKGICENYAALFVAISKKCGIKCIGVDGYTNQNGVQEYMGHAWCAAVVEGTWYLFDPTWGSGYVETGRFFKRINNDYFMAKPSAFIGSHMPFDYMYQFLEYPITNQEFYDGRTYPNKSKPYFNFKDSILAYEKMDTMDQLVQTSYRIKKMGVRNSLLFDRLQHIQTSIENIKVVAFNDAAAEYNAGANLYNDFINFRNKQFMPKKSDPEIQWMLDVVFDKIKAARSKLSAINHPEPSMVSTIAQLHKAIDDLQKQSNEQAGWLKTYFSRPKILRKAMFVDKVMWMGIPLN